MSEQLDFIEQQEDIEQDRLERLRDFIGDRNEPLSNNPSWQDGHDMYRCPKCGFIIYEFSEFDMSVDEEGEREFCPACDFYFEAIH